MPVPDKHASEPVVELNADQVAAWRNAEDAAKRWKNHAATLRAHLEQQIGAATAGTVEGKKVITFRPTSTWAVARLSEDYPDLVQHFMREEIVTSVDIDAFRKQHPDIAEKYRSRSFRWTGNDEP